MKHFLLILAKQIIQLEAAVVDADSLFLTYLYEAIKCWDYFVVALEVVLQVTLQGAETFVDAVTFEVASVTFVVIIVEMALCIVDCYLIVVAVSLMLNKDFVEVEQQNLVFGVPHNHSVPYYEVFDVPLVAPFHDHFVIAFVVQLDVDLTQCYQDA